MKLTLSLVALLTVVGFTVVHADTVYYSPPGQHGIASVVGTIVRETGSVVEITNAEGRTVSIPRADVYQIIRDAPPAAGTAVETESPLVGRGTPSLSAHSRIHREESARSYHFGLKGGMNVSNLSIDPEAFEEEDSLKSYAIGAWWGIPLNRRLAFRTEALYSVKGDAENGDGYTASTQMSYIDVPVLAKIGFMHGSTAQPSLFMGPALALNLTAHSKIESGGGDIDVDVKDQTRAIDLGLVVGGAVDFPLGGRTYGLELRYSKGLSNAVDEDANGSARNNVLAVMGSVRLQ